MNSSSLPVKLGDLRQERINTRRDINTLLVTSRGDGIGRNWRETRLLQLMAKEYCLSKRIEALLFNFATLNFSSAFAVAAFMEMNADLDENGDDVHVVFA